MIVIGFGTGRCGTASLAALINAQRNALCFHEMNPACVRFSGTPGPILDAVSRFEDILAGGDRSMLTVDLSRPYGAACFDRLQGLRQVDLIGDVASYHLNYIEEVASRFEEVRFVFLMRDIEETVASWERWTALGRWRSERWAARLSSLIMRTPYLTALNHWMEHDGTRWKHDPVWDKCFPKFDADDPVSAARLYCHYYYEEVERLKPILGGRLHCIRTHDLGRPARQSELLRFLGVDESDQVHTGAHANRSGKAVRPVPAEPIAPRKAA